MMMAMALYRGETGDESGLHTNLFSTGYHHSSSSSRLPTNPLELAGARNLPRPRRARKKRHTEVSLYPSKAAIEASVPDTTISFDDNGSLQVVRVDNTSNDSGTKKPPPQASTTPPVTSCTNHLLATLMSIESDEDPTGLLVDNIFQKTPARKTSPPNAAAATASSLVAHGTNVISGNTGKKKEKQRSLLLSVPLTSNKRHTSMSSQSSSGSAELHREFHRISLSVKRKPRDDYEDVGHQGPASLDGSTNRNSTSPNNGNDAMQVEQEQHQQQQPSSLHFRLRKMSRLRDDRVGRDDETESNCSSSVEEDSLLNVLGFANRVGQGKETKHSEFTAKFSSLSATPDHFRRSSPPPQQYKRKSLNNQTSQKGVHELKNDSSTTTTTKDDDLVQVQPGLCLPLRGRPETLVAVKTGFVEEINCQACKSELLCIADASYCLCPACQHISPVVDGMASFTSLNKQSQYPKGSVGLGLLTSPSLS